MAKYRVWYGDEPEYKKVSSLAEGLKFFKKHSQYEEDDSGLEEFIDGEWDEWLDEDDQNVHEHLYMYGAKSEYLRARDEDEEDDFDDEEDELEDEDDASDEGDMEDRLMNVIGGNARVKTEDEEDSFDNDEDDLDEDEEDDFDDEDEDE